MTEENFQYRTSPLMLRNQFEGDGFFQIPIIPKASFSEDEFADLLFIAFDQTSRDGKKHLDRMVHFFLYDYRFERVWKNPDQYWARLQPYRAVLSPDFSVYREMNPVLQLYNVFRNRWCGAYFASKGMRVVPTVSWGDENTFDFCFSGVPKGSTVAVSAYIASDHKSQANQKEFFLAGYEEMLRRIEPERILCYHKPIPEMRGNLVPVSWEQSSWRYLQADPKPSPYVKIICGLEPIPENCGIIVKRGYVDFDLDVHLGMGSAFGNRGEANQLKNISRNQANKIARKFGYKNAEELKNDIVPKRGSKFNMKYDPKTREIILESIEDSSIQVPTGLYLD